MTDRYERIRAALAKRPTPGPWNLKDGRTDTVENAQGYPVCAVHWHPDERYGHGTRAAYIAACDPDTIRELLDERDQLAADLEAARVREELKPLRADIGDLICPHSAAGRPERSLAKACILAGECGCVYGAEWSRALRLADDAAESVICTEGQIQRPGVWRITREVLDADRAYLSDCLQHLAWRQMADVAEDHNTGDVIVTKWPAAPSPSAGAPRPA